MVDRRIQYILATSASQETLNSGDVLFFAVGLAAAVLFAAAYVRSRATATYKQVVADDVDAVAMEGSAMQQKKYGSISDRYQIAYDFEPRAQINTEIVHKI